MNSKHLLLLGVVTLLSCANSSKKYYGGISVTFGTDFKQAFESDEQAKKAARDIVNFATGYFVDETIGATVLWSVREIRELDTIIDFTENSKRAIKETYVYRNSKANIFLYLATTYKSDWGFAGSNGELCTGSEDKRIILLPYRRNILTYEKRIKFSGKLLASRIASIIGLLGNEDNRNMYDGEYELHWLRLNTNKVRSNLEEKGHCLKQKCEGVCRMPQTFVGTIHVTLDDSFWKNTKGYAMVATNIIQTASNIFLNNSLGSLVSWNTMGYAGFSSGISFFGETVWENVQKQMETSSTKYTGKDVYVFISGTQQWVRARGRVKMQGGICSSYRVNHAIVLPFLLDLDRDKGIEHAGKYLADLMGRLIGLDCQSVSSVLDSNNGWPWSECNREAFKTTAQPWQNWKNRHCLIGNRGCKMC